MSDFETQDPLEVQVANANRKANAAIRERDEAREEADKLRLSHARLFEALNLYDCDYGCGCFKRHCSEGEPCLAHRLDEVREELRSTRRAIAGDLCLADVARRQREACAAACAARRPPKRDWSLGGCSVGSYDTWAESEEVCKATSLVTEVEK